MSLVQHLAIKQDSQRTVTVLTYEIGDIAKCSIYRESFPGLSGSYSKEMRLAIGDAITMLRLLCEQEDSDFHELLEEGEERFKKRQDEIAGYWRGNDD